MRKTVKNNEKMSTLLEASVTIFNNQIINTKNVTCIY